MFKKLFAALTLLIALPAFANAAVWTVKATSANPTFGTVSPSGYTNLPTTTLTQSITVAPKTANYQISSIMVDGVNKGTTSPVVVPMKAGTTIVVANFATKTYSVTAGPVVGGGGQIASTTTPKVNAGASKTFTVTPYSGYKTLTVMDGATPVTLDASNSFTIANVQADHVVTATFGGVTANAGGNKTAIIGSTVAITGTGTAVGTPTYQWSVVYAPAGASISTDTVLPAGAALSFVADKVGTYNLKLKVTDEAQSATSAVAITVAGSYADIANASANACAACHQASAAFLTSKHWVNTKEYGPEFTGGAVTGEINPNESYATYEGAELTTCSTKCHFKSKTTAVGCNTCHATGQFNGTALKDATKLGMDAPMPTAATTCVVCHSGSKHGITTNGFLGSKHNTNLINESTGARASCAESCHFNPKTNSKVSCLACHDSHLPESATAATTCMVCHLSGSKHGAPTDAFQLSSHNTGDSAKNYYQMNEKACVACHDPHSTVATFTGCNSCHKPGTAYGIFANTSAVRMKAPHGGGVATNSVGGNGTTQYVTQGAICNDCHGHNNTVNAGFAEGGHGAVSSDPLNAFGHYDWNGRTNNGTRQNGNCDRCHTAYGFMKFANQTTGYTRLQLKTGQANNVLICVGCHSNLDNGALRTDATPAGNPTTLAGGYFALFSSAAPTAAGTQGQVAANKTKIELSFPGYKNSSICVPCHAGRSTAAVFVAVIDQAKLVNKNYSTITTSYYQHAANMGQTFTGQGGYDFTGKLATIGTSGHAALKMGATDTQGPCVACHYSKAGFDHSLEVVPSVAGCVATMCHKTVPNVEEAKANFDAGVLALDTLIRYKFAPLQTVVQDLATERGNVRFGRFGKADGVPATDATAKAAYGAWYNWQILATYDKAAYAHNPKYARQILNDTLAYVNSGLTDGKNVDAALLAAQAINPALVTPAVAAAAQGFITAPGCAACHAAKVTTFTTTAGYHFVTKEYACANCHSANLHQSTAAADAPTCRCHGDNATNGAPVLTAMKAVGATCANCHATNDVHSMKAADLTKGCVSCHAVAGAKHGAGVDDNNGVRAITGTSGEFGANTAKKSHHIVNSDGSDPTDAQCLACHAEGTVVAGAVVVDANFHMKDNKTYLRNGGGIPAEVLATELGGNKSTLVSGVSVFAWNPATPDHNLMDQFCFSCHNENGAPVAAAAIVAALPAATATNPFADTISNGYDQMARGKVVNAFGQFDTGNASHHAVRGARYSGKTRTAGADRLVTNPATFANTSSAAFNGVAYEAGKAGPGVRQTLFDAGFFSTSYSPLGSTGTKTTLGDDSTLHCGDCHTVGQWTNTNTTYNKAAIGAHGSVNEYMLRNSQGTDALHNAGRDNSTAWNDASDDMVDINGKASLVCYNCHAFSRYGALGKHEGVNSGLDCNGDVWTNAAAGRIGSARLLREAPFTSNGEGSNMFGIQCANCHNSGPAAQFGGIHGGNITYTDGTGATQKPYRFLPGLGNVKYAPNNHLRNDGKTTFSGSPAETAAINAAKNTNTPELTNTWEEKTLFTGSRATCYTLNEGATGSMPAKGMKNPATDAYAPGQLVTGTWGACTDHGGSSIAGGHAGTGNTIRNPALRDVQRPLTY